MNRKTIERELQIELDDNLSDDDDYLLENLSDALDEVEWWLRQIRRFKE